MSGYFENQDGFINTLFENRTLGNDGIEVTYPGRPIDIIMFHDNKSYPFIVPFPSFWQSLNLALNDSLIGKVVLPLYAISTIILAGFLYVQRDLYIQTFRGQIKELNEKIRGKDKEKYRFRPK